MEKWFVPDHMKKLAGSTTRLFGYDQTNTVDYTFNNLGFRSQEPKQHARLAVIGNSVSFGIGLTAEQTYANMLAQKLDLELDNLSLGCYLHENHDHLHNIELLAKQDIETVFVVQINNLDRVRVDGSVVSCVNDPNICVKKFLDYFDQLIQILVHRPCLFIYWDHKQFNLPDSVVKKISLYNKFHLDQSLPNNTDTFGPNSHKAIAQSLFQIISAGKVQPR